MNTGVLAAVLTLGMAATACQPAAVSAEADADCVGVRETNSCATFNKALAECRFLHTGRGSRRALLPPTEPHVADCLRKKGWLPSGESTDASAEAETAPDR